MVFFHPSDALKLFDSGMLWSRNLGYTYSEEIERIQTKFCKQYLSLRQNTNYAFALGECGRFPVAVSYMTQAIKYWLKLLYMPNNRYSRHWYLMLKSLADAGKTTWTKHIKSILFEYGFGYAWIENEVGNSTHFSNSFKQRIKDISIQNWHQSITNSSKATNYKHFKEVCCQQLADFYFLFLFC